MANESDGCSIVGCSRPSFLMVDDFWYCSQCGYEVFAAVMNTRDRLEYEMLAKLIGEPVTLSATVRERMKEAEHAHYSR